MYTYRKNLSIHRVRVCLWFQASTGGTWHIYPPGKGGLLYFEFAVQGSGRRDLLALCQHSGGKRGSMNKAYADQIWGLPPLLPSFGIVLLGPPTGICPGATSQSSSLQSVPTPPKLHQDFPTRVPTPFKSYTLLSGRHYIQYMSHLYLTHESEKLPSRTIYVCFSGVLWRWCPDTKEWVQWGKPGPVTGEKGVGIEAGSSFSGNPYLLFYTSLLPNNIGGHVWL